MPALIEEEKRRVDEYFSEQLGQRVTWTQKLRDFDQALVVLGHTPYGSQKNCPWTVQDEKDDIEYHAGIQSGEIEQAKFSRDGCRFLVKRNLKLFASEGGKVWLATYKRRIALIKPTIKHEVAFFEGFAVRHLDAIEQQRLALADYLTARATAADLRSFWLKLGDVCLAFTSMFATGNPSHERFTYLWQFHDDLVRYHYPSKSYDLANTDDQLKIQVHALSEEGRILIERIQDVRLVLGATPGQLGDHYNFGNLPTHILSSDRARRDAIETVAKRTTLLNFHEAHPDARNHH